MAIIKCPECGHEISDKAGTCIHCGCPISAIQEPTDNSGTFVVYGYTEWYLLKPTLQIYLNGEYIGDVSYRAKTKKIPIQGTSEVKIKYGFRTATVQVPARIHSEIHVEFNRLTGSLMAEIRSN